MSEAQKRRARKIATLVFLTLVSAWVLGATSQIVRQAMFPAATPNPWGTCAQGMSGLHGALDRARSASEVEVESDPDRALARFRAALDPEWQSLQGVRATCTDPRQRRSLDALERLRYAEEHAVRREAASLAVLRRQVASDVAPR